MGSGYNDMILHVHYLSITSMLKLELTRVYSLHGTFNSLYYCH